MREYEEFVFAATVACQAVKNGILEVRLPRAESAKARRIPVKAN